MSLAVAVADYAAGFAIRSEPALAAARQCLIEALAHGFESLRDPACAVLMAPLVPGAVMPGGARVPGTSLELDPAQAAFCLGAMLCRSGDGADWLELPYSCAAASLGAVLATADYLARKARMEGQRPPAVRDVLAAAVKSLEIQALLAPARGEPFTWTAAVRRVRLATAAVATAQLGGGRGEIVSALGYASLEGGASIDSSADAGERCGFGRRHWAIAEAVSRAVRHSCQAMAFRHSGQPAALGAETVDPTDALLGGPRIASGPFGTEFLLRLASRRGSPEITRLAARFQAAIDGYFPARQAERIKALFAAPERLDDLPVNELLAALVTNGAR